MLLQFVRIVEASHTNGGYVRVSPHMWHRLAIRHIVRCEMAQSASKVIRLAVINPQEVVHNRGKQG